MNNNGDPVNILLVEDNPGDVRLVQEALKDSKIRNNLFRVENGQEAINYLNKEGEYSDSVRPDLILLDLDMPQLDGREALEIIKKDPELKRIPIVVLTVSQSEQDVLESYNLQANAYVTKPLDLDQFIKVIHSIEDFWFTIVKFPNEK